MNLKNELCLQAYLRLFITIDLINRARDKED